tara:strand:- start:18603 stop:18719 length:117 start_codon:yes stop_codon:yes gene_type:complete
LGFGIWDLGFGIYPFIEDILEETRVRFIEIFVKCYLKP